MKLFKLLSFIGLTIVLLASCANIYYSPYTKTLANKYQMIAIMPPKIFITANKNIDAEAIKEQQKKESANFQNKIYSWLLKRKKQGKITKKIQDIQTTNAKLAKAGYFDNPLNTAELCETLGVDGIITSNFSITKSMSNDAAIVLGLLAGAWSPTNEVHAILSISDCENKKLIWNYEHTENGSVGSSPARIVDQLMKQASKKMTHIIK